MRFNNLQVPRGAVIESASIEFEVDETSSGSTLVTIKGENTDNAAVITGNNNDISSRPVTSARVDWDIPAWNTVSSKQQSPDIASIISEIVNRPGWSAGNSIVITVSGSGRRTAESYNGESANAPKLTVIYSTQDGITPTPSSTQSPTPTGSITPILTPSLMPTIAPTPIGIPAATTTPFPSNTPTPTDAAAPPSSFIFTTAGDYGANNHATSVLSTMNPVNSSASFNLVVGDFSYANLIPETAWCDYVKNNVGQDFPFELVSGNHEDNELSGNNIDNFVTCLPDRIGNINGTYGKEYYFEYPLSDPYARFIMISPDLSFTTGETYSYTVGSSHYNWLSSTIDNARASGIRWIVIGMHKNCLTMGTKSCEISSDLINLLVAKKVDLILQGHDHTYQRSKQLSLGPSCSAIAANNYNPGCIVDDGADNQYIRGAGPVLVIIGTGGHGLYDINTADPEAGYFAAWSGNNILPSYGFLKVTATDSKFTAQFISTTGTFTDSFEIIDLPCLLPLPHQPSRLAILLPLSLLLQHPLLSHQKLSLHKLPLPRMMRRKGFPTAALI